MNILPAVFEQVIYRILKLFVLILEQFRLYSISKYLFFVYVLVFAQIREELNGLEYAKPYLMNFLVHQLGLWYEGYYVLQFHAHCRHLSIAAWIFGMVVKTYARIDAIICSLIVLQDNLRAFFNYLLLHLLHLIDSHIDFTLQFLANHA